MPKITRGHKRGGRTAVTNRAAPRAVGDLIARGPAVLSRISDQSARQTFWRSWLSEQLPQELDAHLTGAVERDGALTLFADSAAWAARLRYALRELKPAIDRARANIQEIKVKVLPRK